MTDAQFPPKFKATRDLEDDVRKLETKVWRLKQERQQLKKKVRKLKEKVASRSVDAVGGGEVEVYPYVDEPKLKGKRK